MTTGNQPYLSNRLPQEPPAGVLPVRITASRPVLDRREPSLSFQVSAPAMQYFDVVVATDPQLFLPEEAHRRTAKNFRISRQDFEGQPIEMETGFYMLPRAFLRDVISVTPRPTRLFYIAIAYANDAAENGMFSTPLEQIAAAPHVTLSMDMTADSLSRVLGQAVERIGVVNGAGRVVHPRRDSAQVEMPRMIGGLPLTPLQPAPAFPPAHTQEPMQAPMPKPQPGPQDVTEPARQPPAATPPQNRMLPEQPQQPPLTAPSPVTPAPASGTGTGQNGAAQSPPTGISTAQHAPAGDAFVDEDMLYGAPGQGGVRDIDAPAFRDLDAASLTQCTGYDDGFGAMSFEHPDVKDATQIPPLDPVPDAAAPVAQPGAAQPAPAAVAHPSPAPVPTAQRSPAVGQPSPSEPDQIAPAQPTPAEPVPNGQAGAAANPQDLLVQLVIDRGAGNRYEALNLDGAFRGRAGTDHPYYQRAHEGLRFGPHQVSQDSGELGELLGLMQAADPVQFEQVFGTSAAQLVQTTTAQGPSSLDVPGGRSARVQPIDGKDLWEDPWTGRFRQAAAHPPFQAAMRAQIIARRLEPILPIAEAVGLGDQQGQAMVLAMTIHLGVEATQTALRVAVNPFDSPARTAAALEALGHSGLTAFQQANGLALSDTITPETHFALIRALRALGPEGPVAIPDGEAAKDMLVMSQPPGVVGDALLKLRNDDSLMAANGEGR